MERSFLEIFNEFQKCMISKSIQLENSKFNNSLSQISFYFVDHENPFKKDLNQLKELTRIIVIDKYIDTQRNENIIYLIISFYQTVIIIEQSNLSIIQEIFTINDKSVVYFLSGAKDYFNQPNLIKLNESDKDFTIFQIEIQNFRKKILIKKIYNSNICKFWNIINSSLSGFFIKVSYSKMNDRINNFFNTSDEEDKLNEIVFDENDYVTLRNIGIGYSGCIELIYHIEKCELFALKIFKNQENLKHQKRECTSELNNHPFISKRYGTVKNLNSIVIEFINGPLLQNCVNLESKDKIKIIFEIMIIVEYLHNHHYIYRDLKPDNIIIDNQSKTAVLIDFDRMIKIEDGFKDKEISNDFSTIFFAPEIEKNRVLYANDIYSIGMLIYFILTIELQNNKERDFKFDLIEFKNIPEEFSKFRKLCKKCTNLIPEERPKISELINEFYFMFFSKIQNQEKCILDSDIKTVAEVADIHTIKFSKFWISLAEYEKQFCQLYKKSIKFYIKYVIQSIRESCTFNSKLSSNQNYSVFENLPHNYCSEMKIIQNEIIQKMYSNFSFFYFNSSKNKLCQNEFDDILLDILKEFKFITFKMSSIQEKTNAIFCVEGKCFILECSNNFQINKVIDKIKESKTIIIINVDSNSKTTNEVNDYKEINEEIENFVKSFQEEINQNEFVSFTISTITCYLIRRYYCPTEYFIDKNFFTFEEKYKNEREMKNKFISFLKTKKGEEIHYFYDIIINKIIENNYFDNENEPKNMINFNEKDFIILRQLHSSENHESFLVIHTKSLHIFMMKKINKIEENYNEIYICQNFTHDSFIKFYGFVKENDKIIGFIYEFMNKGSLKSFLSKSEQIDPLYFLLIITSLFRGIEYFQKNSLYYNDFSPLNIFVDHDGIVHFSKSKTILITDGKNYSQDKNISINSLFCSYSKIVNFLYENYEKKKSINYIKLANDDFISTFIKKIHECCIENNLDNLAKCKHIKQIIFDEIKSFDYFELSILKERNHLKILQIFQFFYDSFMLYYEDSNEIDNFLTNISIFSFLFLLKKKIEKSIIFLLLGLYYINRKSLKNNYLKAKEYFELSAQLKNSYAFFYLSVLYHDGKYVKQDHIKEREYLELSAQLNNPNALYNLGLLYQTGTGVQPNYLKAIKFYELSAQHNNSYALNNMASLYLNGQGVKQDFTKALEYYKLSSQLNNSNALLSLGILYFSGKGIKQDYLKAIEYFELSADLNNERAAYNLGIIYKDGKYIKQDFLKAKKYFELAASFNNSDALLNLGILYYNGQGAKQDYLKAKEYYELSASFNNSEALRLLGCLYFNGKGVEQDYTKAKKYYKLSAKFNNDSSLLTLGFLYKDGIGCKQNFSKSMKYFELSAKLSNSEALNYLGYFYLNGIGVRKNYSKAKECFELSASFNNSNALYNLGNLYLNGNGVTQNYLKAIQYFELSSQFNNMNALKMLGNIYLKGLGVKKNQMKAKKYYELASKLKDPLSTLILNILYLTNYDNSIDYIKVKEYFEFLAQKNIACGFFGLGSIYMQGLGVKLNYLKAEKYFKTSLMLIQTNTNNKLTNYFFTDNFLKQNNLDNTEYVDRIIKSYSNYCLGILYMNGFGVKQNYIKAKQYFELSAQFLNPTALLILGFLYENGVGVKTNYQIAIQYYEVSAQLNNSDALVSLGDFYITGKVVKQDLLKAIKYYELSASLNNPIAFYKLGNLYLLGFIVEQNLDKAKEYFELSAQQNYSYAIYKLGYIYNKGLGVPKDYLKAKKYYEISAGLDNSAALFELGLMHDDDQWKENNHTKAMKYYELSAQKNNSDALHRLGYIYFYGEKVEKDILKAKRYFELSSSLGNSTSILFLGQMYLDGDGVEIDYIKAKNLFEMSVHLNDPMAQYFLGLCYSNGDVFEVDIPKAIEYYKKCQEKHFNCFLNPEFIKINRFYYNSCNDLGLIYITVYKDIKEAFNYIKEAGFGEYPFGQNNLGLLFQYYYNNIENAKYMYERSLKHKFALSAFNLGQMEESIGKIENSIKYYIKASEYEDEPLIFNNRKCNDKRLNISKNFIICFTNLKLSEYFYSKGETKEFKKYFIKSLSKIEIDTSDLQYKFHFEYQKNNKKIKNSFSYLKYFIFNFPYFNLTKQPYLNEKIKETLQKLNKKDFNSHYKSNDTKFSYQKENQINCVIELQTKENLINKNNQTTKYKCDNSKFINKSQNEKVKQNKEVAKLNEKLIKENSSTQKNDTKNDAKYFYNKKFNESNENKMDFELTNNEEIIIFKNAEELIDFVIKDDNLIKALNEEIQEIIDIMKEILYTPPYCFLFGRINIEKEAAKNIDNIDKSFYEGFGILKNADFFLTS